MSPWLSHNHSARLSVADDTEDVENWTESERNSISGWCIEDQPSETTASLISFVSCLFRSWQTLTTLNLQWNRTWATGARYLADALEINQVNYDLLLFNIDWIIRLFLDTHRSRSWHQQHRSWRCSASDWGIENQPSKTELHFTSMLDSFSSKTLSTLGLSKNDIRNEGAQYLADALKINEVREDLISIDYRPSNPCQTLKTLELRENKIDHTGVQILAEALKINRVKRYLFSHHLNDVLLLLHRRWSHLTFRRTMLELDGARYLADALKINRVRHDVFPSRNRTMLGRDSWHWLWRAIRLAPKGSSTSLMPWKSIEWDRNLFSSALKRSFFLFTDTDDIAAKMESHWQHRSPDSCWGVENQSSKSASLLYHLNDVLLFSIDADHTWPFEEQCWNWRSSVSGWCLEDQSSETRFLPLLRNSMIVSFIHRCWQRWIFRATRSTMKEGHVSLKRWKSIT